MIKSRLAVLLCLFAILCVGAGSAFAGEIRGPGSPTGIPAEGPDTAALANTNSICAASGLNEYHAGEPGELPIRTQSWGQLEKSGDADFLRSIGVTPGTACNGHLSGLK
jgi:hypothetical protein